MTPPVTCPFCQAVDTAPEDSLRKLVKVQEAKLHRAQDQALELAAAHARIRELEDIVERQNRRLRRRPA